MSNLTKIYTLIPLASKDVGAIAKNRTNRSQNYQFRGIEDFMNELHPVMCKHGISMGTTIIQSDHKFIPAETGDKFKMLSSVRMSAKFYADDGSCIEGQGEGLALDHSGDKSANKAMSAAMKYILGHTFMIGTEDMTDSDADENQGPKEKSPLEKFDEWGLANAVEIEQSGNGVAWGAAMKGARLEALATIRKQVIEWKRAK